MEEKIFYTPLTYADREAFFSLTGEPRVAATMRFACPKTQGESDQILADYLAEGNRCYGLRFAPEGEMWGVFAFKGDENSKTASLSQMEKPACWGRGLGKKVLSDMVKLARNERVYQALECYILEHNEASCALAEGEGFQIKARHRFAGMKEDLLVYRLELGTDEGGKTDDFDPAAADPAH